MISAIIVAAGKGVRMNAATKKQYLHVGGEPIVVRSLRAFSGCRRIDGIYVVVPPSDVDHCRKLLQGVPGIRPDCRVVAGGETRQQSVFHGLLSMEADVSENDLVAIHDGVRPLVTRDQIEACIASAEKTGACILALPAQDTIKHVDTAGIITGTRTSGDIWLAQTPQVFTYALIRAAHERAVKEGIEATDDAMLVERVSFPVHVVQGSKTNLKITTPEDIALAEALLSMAEGRLVKPFPPLPADPNEAVRPGVISKSDLK